MSYTNTTLAQFREQCRSRLFATFWTDAELNAYINESLRVWNVLTGYWKETTTFVVPADTTYLSLVEFFPSYLSLIRIELDTYHLNLVSLKELDSFAYNWQCEEGPPREAAIIGLDRIAFHPHPLVDTSMDFTYIKKAPIVSADGDFIDLSEEEICGLRDYVHFIASIKEGGQELQSNIPQLKSFLSKCSAYNAKLNKISSFHKLLGWAGYSVARPDDLAASPRGLNQEESTQWPTQSPMRRS